ncbi:hypothetical protein J6590_071126 [Homalodisca vitripennis]|nr:hypothetical protein J6590_071124 [Homalodisca vitripennis]KAG8320347.1 hypothetical protein J6590_071125 [Homalodisca vitripennis]KAG8320348.1 hypothetical protein J6590_071126 [Homalodisca vitripennis]
MLAAGNRLGFCRVYYNDVNVIYENRHFIDSPSSQLNVSLVILFLIVLNYLSSELQDFCRVYYDIVNFIYDNHLFKNSPSSQLYVSLVSNLKCT